MRSSSPGLSAAVCGLSRTFSSSHSGLSRAGGSQEATSSACPAQLPAGHAHAASELLARQEPAQVPCQERADALVLARASAAVCGLSAGQGAQQRRLVDDLAAPDVDHDRAAAQAPQRLGVDAPAGSVGQRQRHGP